VAPYKPRFTLWWFEPYLAWQPTYVTDTVGISQLRTGVSLVGGELRGNLSMGGSAYISKDFRDGAGPSWGGDLVFGLRVPSIFGENRDLVPEAQVFGSHEVIRNENAFSTDYHPTRTDFTKTPPNDFSLFVEPDTLIGVYSDLFEGVFHDERAFTQYGISAGLSLNRSNQLGLYYARLRDHYSGSYYGYRSRRLGRLLLSDSERFEDVVDLTGAELADPNQQAAVDSWERWIHHEVADTTPSRDLVDYFDRFSIYADHRVGLSYQFTNVRPRFGVPARVDYISLGGQFTRGALTIDSYYGDGDTVIEHGDDRELFVRFDPSGNQIPHLTPVEETRDFFKVELAALERFPLPGNRLMGEWPRGARGGHFCTVNLFLGSLNRRLPSEANTWPLQYRIAQFMKAYPYAFDPVDLGTVEYPIAVDRMDSRGNYLGPDTLLYTYLGDTHHEDIMWGNGIFYGSIEYTLEILRGANLHGPGLMLRGLYITPFLEWSKLWNGDWSDLEIEVDRNEPPWEWVTYHGTKRPLLRDWGVRTELALVMATVWNASLSFTWARRLDLDSALLDYEQTGNRVTKTYLDKDRFSVGLHVW